MVLQEKRQKYDASKTEAKETEAAMVRKPTAFMIFDVYSALLCQLKSYSRFRIIFNNPSNFCFAARVCRSIKQTTWKDARGKLSWCVYMINYQLFISFLLAVTKLIILRINIDDCDQISMHSHLTVFKFISFSYFMVIHFNPLK